MIFEYKREWLSKELDKKQTALGQMTTPLMRHLERVKENDNITEKRGLKSVQRYIDVINQIKVCLELCERLLDQVQDETQWVTGQDYKSQTKIDEKFFEWQNSIKLYVNATLTFATQMVDVAPVFIAYLEKYDEEQNKLIELVQDLQPPIEHIIDKYDDVQE